ncbi:MAG: methylmalonyl Co-A mutase-associated GTPase MeaB [Thermoplasmataceae archaeon]
MKIDDIIRGILSADKRSIARAISIVEDDDKVQECSTIIRGIFGYTGHSHVVGITGPPGIGKSTMIGKLSKKLADRAKKVSVIAVDASSPFSGGSLLGNRIRMQDSLTENGIFMRSLANRGVNGGLSRSTWDAVKILDASGSDYVIIETVGAGQADLDIINLADTVVVVLGPGLGDEIQAIKAGIMEIGDIFVVNKMDREGAFLAMKDIQDSLSLSPQKEWKVPVIGTSSVKDQGYDELISEIDGHRLFIERKPEIREVRFKKEVEMALQAEIRRQYVYETKKLLERDNSVAEFLKNRIDPYTAAIEIMKSARAGL